MEFCVVKKRIKQGNNLASAIDKSILESVGIDEKTDIEILVIEGNILIKPHVTTKLTNKKKQGLEESAKRIMDKYGPLFKKLAKT